MKRFFFVLVAVCLLAAVAHSQVQVQSPVTAPPQLTEDRLFAMLGQKQAQIELQQQYISQLQQQVASLHDENQKLKNPEKPKP